MEQPQINVAGIYQQTRTRYITEARKTLPLQERIEVALPWFMVVIQLVFFALSASHTASMVARIVPPFDIFGLKVPIAPLAPVGFELGLSVVAMMNYSTKKRGDTPPGSWIFIEGLLFITTLISNLAGSLIEATKQQSVVQTVGIADISLILSIIMAIVFSFIIPVGNKVIGQATMHLILEHRTNGDPAERRWRIVEFQETYTAFFQAYMQSGLTAGKAKQLAISAATGFVSASTTARPALPAPLSESDKSDIPNTSDKADKTRTNRTDESDGNRTVPNGQPDSRVKSGVRVRQHVQSVLSANPGMTLNDIVVRDVARQVGVSPDTASRIVREMKSESTDVEVQQ